VATTSDLHVLGTNIKIADFSKILAKGAVEWPIARGIVGTIRTCRYI